MTKSITITPEESAKVEHLFYDYNALLDIIKVLTEQNQIYFDLLTELKATKFELEQAKDEVIKKYGDITKNNINYTFNFRTCTLDYEDVQ